MGHARSIIEAVVAVLETPARQTALMDPELRALTIEVKINARTGEARVVLVTPTFETDLGALDSR